MRRGARSEGRLEILIAAILCGIATLFVTRYPIPFRLDDVLLVEWAHAHPIWDAFDPIRGQIVNSVRPLFAITAFVLTNVAGLQHPFWWHLTLVATLIVGLYLTGKTSSLLAERRAALAVAVGLYFLAFYPILNVFFWFSDLTYGLELCFAGFAWYFGLRGLRGAKLNDWLLGLLFATMAILSKEPAVVLIHVIFLLSLLLEYKNITLAWQNADRRDRWIAVLAYLGLCAITGYILGVSPTRTNRFFSLGDSRIQYFVGDRLRYYSDIFSRVPNRIFLIFPVLGEAALAILDAKRLLKFRHAAIAICVCLVIAVVVCSNIIVGSAAMLVGVCIAAIYGDRVTLRTIPFAVSMLIASITLQFTIQLVKTQLTEIAFLSSLISGASWAVLFTRIRPSLTHVRTNNRKLWRASLLGSSGVVLAGLLMLAPSLVRQEKVLGEVRDVRWNANDAIQWCANHLPRSATLGVASYELHGLTGGSLTGRSDEEKLHSQYTFESGYVFVYLAQLGRGDIQRAYLDDTTLVPRVFEAMRQQGGGYVLLQSALDVERFHAMRVLTARDSLTARFARGSYPSEVWMLRE